MKIIKALFSSRKKNSRHIAKLLFTVIDKGMEAHIKKLMLKIEKAEYEQHSKKNK